jgi:L-amino acid N-acyltransferase YncA
MEIATMHAANASAVLRIYQEGLDSGDASFETAAPDWPTFDRKYLPQHRFVALDEDGRVLGWVALAPTSAREVYRGVVEHSLYVAAAARGSGVGKALLRKVIAASEAGGVWTLQAGVFPENTASIALHRASGFRQVGVRERIGCHHGVWRDVVLLERRRS